MMRILILLHNHGGEVEKWTILKNETRFSNSKLNSAIERLISLGLIKKEKTSTAPPTTVIALTEKGEKVTECLVKIEELIQS
jgi:DNA-binding HxlR family transcriptional regulator